jgi:serine/threonine protein kinase
MSTLPPDDDDRTVIRPPTAAPAAADHGNALPVGTCLGEFELTRVLGEGGFGIVYLARDHSLHRLVALKEYMPSALAARTGSTQVAVKSERHRETFELGLNSFINEARLLAQFDHASLVKVYRFWEANGTAYMVMPFYEGITLKDKLRQIGSPPDEAWLMGLLAPLTEALGVIHAERCYHRDIAPDNIILLAGSGRPLLLDFGAARRVIGDMSQPLTVILKPGYAPPEQYAEVPSMKQGPWTDLYALAAVLHDAIMRSTPPPSVSRMMADHHVPLAEAAAGRYSARFLRAIDKALRVKPEERTQTVAELRADLGLGVHDVIPDDTRPATIGDSVLPPHAVITTRPATATAAPGKRLWRGLGGAGVLVVGGAAAFFTWTRTAAPPAPSPAPPITFAATPAALATPAAPAESPRPFVALAEFDRIVHAQTPGFTVEAWPAKPTLRISRRDKLSFSLRSQQDGNVYVLLRGPDDSLIQLFPNSVAKKNQLKAGQTLTLPQASWPLDAAEPIGPEHFLVIVSRQPRDFSRFGKARDGWFMKFPSGPSANAAIRGYTGPGSALAGDTHCEDAGCGAYGATRFTINVVR